MDAVNVCTIISKNYLAHARTFTDSFLKANPMGKVFVLLVDDLDGAFFPKNEKFFLINIDEIGLDSKDQFCFKYNVLEQNTGVKAIFLKYLLTKYGFNKIAYFDPDILITNSLENLWKVLDKKDIILTPHITEPIEDDKKPSEYDILLSGTYNLGFIALKNNPNSIKFLQWWNKHLMEFGYSDPKSGLFTDQKWIDLVPTLFDKTFVIKHPGYNVAYWNLKERNVEIKNGKIFSNSKPLYFFHFSGFIPENIERVSKHQNRFSLSDLESVRSLFELYRDLLVENGYLEVKKLKFKYDYFDNGIKIPQFARNVYRNIQNKEKYGNPFSTSTSNSFFEFLNLNIDKKNPPISNLWYQVYNDREDLKKAFPDPLGADRNRFASWITHTGVIEGNMSDVFITHMKDGHSKQILSQKFGLNVSGYFKGDFGVGQSARNYLQAIKTLNIPYVLNNINAGSQKNEHEISEKFHEENPYPVNLIIINADQVPVFSKSMGSEYLERYNIGVWAWELEEFPKIWINNLKKFSEIWAVSSFVAKSISKVSSIPVIPLPCPIQIDISKLSNDRKSFGIDKDKFVFLFIFDFLSFSKRKNPLGLIKAYKNAISEKDQAVLIIKCINGKKFPKEFNELKKECQQNKIVLMTDNLSKIELLSLINCSDCYVSLHRAEGFGLTLAEAMYLGKPVIGTGYSGNMDFMDEISSYPVEYSLTEITNDEGPYSKGNFWAEPNLIHASKLIKYVFENQIEAKKKGEIGSEQIRKKFSPETIGNKIKERMNQIEQII